MNIDGVKRKTPALPKQKAIPQVVHIAPRPAVRQIKQRRIISTKHIGLMHFIDRKQLVTIIATFLVTFVFSIATSQGLASVTNAHRDSLVDEPVVQSSSTSFAVTSQPQILTLDQRVLTRPGEVYLPKENINLPDPLQKRQEFLQKYLSAKHSPLADHVEAISEQSQWKLIIGISRAESSFCKHQVTNNCWGIGGAWNMKNYKNYDEAVADVNRILEKLYINAGLDTPKEIVRKYVGHQSDTWQAAVEQELENLADVE